MKATLGKIGLLVLALAALQAISAQAQTVTATLSPIDIALGDTTQLRVTISDSQDRVELPPIDGLDVVGTSQFSSVNISNGSVSVTASIVYTLSPEHEGTFIIPALRVGSSSSKPITLRVGKGTGGSPALPPPSLGPVVNPGAVATPAPAPNPSAPAQPRYGWIQVTLPRKQLFVGELMPVEIKACVDDAQSPQIIDVPEFTSNALTLGALGKNPEVNAEVLNGVSYHTLTWHTSLAAAKAGTYAIDLKMPLVVVVPVRMPQGGGGFDDLIRSTFASMGERKKITISNGQDSVQVLALPQENRPTDFSGAVGQFEIAASATPVNVSAGDPITYRLKVGGKGNFDRVLSNVLAADASWKTYSPKNSFEPADSVGYAGTKTFEQPIIPIDAGVTSIPAVNFSYFDPEKRQYVTRSAAPIAVTVTGSNRALGAANPVASANPSSPSPMPAQPAPPAATGPGGDLVMNKIEPGTFFATLRPVYLNPLFLAGQAVPLVALFAGMFFVRRQRRGVDQARLRANAANLAIRQQIATMDEAMKNHDTGAFFIGARGALQQRFGLQWNLRPETITMADIHARLGEESQKIRPIFEMADQVSYSALHVGDADLAQWRDLVVKELAEKNR